MSAHLDREQLVRWRDDGASADRDAVLLHLSSCPACAATYAELVRTGPEAQSPARFNPADFVRRGYAVREQVARRSGSTLPAWIQAVWNPSIPVARVMVISQAALILLLAVAAAVPGFRDRAFGTLSGSPPSTTGTRLTVTFEPNASEQSVRELLLSVSGTIVSGPSALGVYVVEVPVQADDDAAVQSTIDELRARAGIVRFVEREP